MAVARSETRVLSQALAEEMVIVVILIFCPLLSIVGSWGSPNHSVTV